MKVVWRRDVNDVDALVGEHRLHRLIRRGQAGGAGSLGPASGARADDAMDLDAQPSQCVHVHRSDEAGADYGCSELATH
jgi:hypothetical protein